MTNNAAPVELQRLDIVDEVMGRPRGPVFAYTTYLSLLDEDAAPLTGE